MFKLYYDSIIARTVKNDLVSGCWVLNGLASCDIFSIVIYRYIHKIAFINMHRKEGTQIDY